MQSNAMIEPAESAPVPKLRDAPAAHLSHRHIPALDGLRGLAALGVLFFHFPYPHWINPVAQTAARRLIFLGQSGVDLFFVLSGFLITGILLDAKGSPGFLRNFYMRRALRIFPLYYGVILVYFLVPPLFGEPFFGKDMLIYSTYFQSILPRSPENPLHGPGPFWSLAVEEHFYLLWPMLVLLLSESRLRIAVLAILAGSIITRACLLPYHIDIFYMSPCRFDAISIGSLVALLMREPKWRDWLTRHALACFVGVLLIFGPLYIVMSGSASYFQQIYKYTIVAIIYAALLILTLAPADKSVAARIFNWRPLRHVGKISYGVYVYHPFIYALADQFDDKFFSSRSPVMVGVLAFIKLLICLAATFLAAWLSWHLFEKQFLRLKRHFEYRGKPAPK